MSDAKVTHADGLGLALVVQFQQRTPHLLARVGAGVRAVNEEQVDVAVLVDLVDAVDAFLVRLFDRAPRGEDFGGDVNFGALEARLAHGLADFLLVRVVLGAVDVAVSGL